ncbi:metallophosphoesterase [Candidatus Woesearchaeota archaeon]|nr:metallophosphoesterase [Candidatus Woesearchaeota archaeon]
MKFIDLCLYFEKEKVLILSDLHIGLEESLNKQGILIPRLQFEEMLSRLKIILEKLEIDKIIINGDLKHEFGIISKTEWTNTLDLLDLLGKHCKEIILILGNHDKVLGPIASRQNLKTFQYYHFSDIFVCHGDVIFDNKDYKKSKLLVIGHEHPAVGLREESRVENYKCFLIGKYENKKLIVLPSFNLVTIGTDVLKESLLSPYLKDISNFEVKVISDKEILDFGKVKDLKRLIKSNFPAVAIKKSLAKDSFSKKKKRIS